MEHNSKRRVFVIGGGYAAAEESMFLTKFASHVTILIRGDDFTCAKSIADELDIEVDEVNNIINRVNRNKHKSKVPESPKKTLMVI